ncbi:MAG: lipopolysaccharide biosynthesis protein, partial [Hyphomicrobiaceae bacterium]
MATTHQASQGTAAPLPASAVERFYVFVRNLILGDDEGGQVRRRAASAFLVRVASAGLLYLTQILLARFMGGFEYGIYVSVWTWVLILGGLSNLGLPTLMIRLVPEHRVHGDWDKLRGLLLYGRLLPLAMATAVAGAGLAALAYSEHLVPGPYVVPAMVTMLCVPMITLNDVQDGIGRGRGWMMTALLPPYMLRPLLVLNAMGIAYLAGFPRVAATAAGAAVVAT